MLAFPDTHVLSLSYRALAGNLRTNLPFENEKGTCVWHDSADERARLTEVASVASRHHVGSSGGAVAESVSGGNPAIRGKKVERPRA